VVTEPSVFRVSAAVAAATAAVGAAVMRRWDVEAGKRVADLTRARASDEWLHEEQVAELETELEDSRELRRKLDHKLRAKRVELAGLRNEHAALLRRYATAETERASALEGRRLLAIEASTEPALPLAEKPVGDEARPVAPSGSEAVAAVSGEQPADGPPAPGVFSPAGSALFLAAHSALDRLVKGDLKTATAEKAEPAAERTPEDEPYEDGSPEDDSHKGGSRGSAALKRGAADGGTPLSGGAEAGSGQVGSQQVGSGRPGAAPADAASDPDTGEHGGPEKQLETVHRQRHTRPAPAARELASATAAGAAPAMPRPALPVRPSGHFTIPTAVAVVPATPRRCLAAGGGFDFFGTQKGAAAIEDVQNEDLADVVGQEVLALHKAESEARFKPADEESRGVGQVIDLTAHDETEQIDVQRLRSAVS
jgi:hypothetical protein